MATRHSLYPISLPTLDFAAAGSILQLREERNKSSFWGWQNSQWPACRKALGWPLLPHLVLLKPLLLIDPKCLFWERCFHLLQQSHVHWFVGVTGHGLCCSRGTITIKPPSCTFPLRLQFQWKLEVVWGGVKCLMKAHFRCQLRPLINPLKWDLPIKDPQKILGVALRVIGNFPH